MLNALSARAVIAACLLVSIIGSSADLNAEGACKSCGGTKTVKCKDTVPDTAEFLFCSECTVKKCCNGSGLATCKKCRDEETAKEIAANLEKAAEWAGRIEKLPASKSVSPVYIETRHFMVCASIGELELKDGKKKKKLTAHQAAHFYADRLEGLYSIFCETFGKDPKMFGDRPKYYILNNQEFGTNLANQLCGSTGPLGNMRLTDKPASVVVYDAATFTEDGQFYLYLMHDTAHMFTGTYAAMAAQLPAWLDEGIAHFYERKYFDNNVDFCMQHEDLKATIKSTGFKAEVVKPPEAEPGDNDWKRADWPSAIADALSRNSCKKLSDITALTRDKLPFQGHAVAWSYVDYLMSLGPEKFAQYIQKIKMRSSPDDALKAAYGKTFAEIEPDWQEYAKAKAPQKQPKKNK